MDPSAVNQVVDKLSDKIGVAADKLAPIAQTLVAETATSNFIGGLLCVGVIAACAGTLYKVYHITKAWPAARYDHEVSPKQGVRVGATLGLAVPALILAGFAASYFVAASCPTLTLLQSLK